MFGSIPQIALRSFIALVLGALVCSHSVAGSPACPSLREIFIDLGRVVSAAVPNRPFFPGNLNRLYQMISSGAPQVTLIVERTRLGKSSLLANLARRWSQGPAVRVNAMSLMQYPVGTISDRRHVFFEAYTMFLESDGIILPPEVKAQVLASSNLSLGNGLALLQRHFAAHGQRPLLLLDEVGEMLDPENDPEALQLHAELLAVRDFDLVLAYPNQTESALITNRQQIEAQVVPPARPRVFRIQPEDAASLEAYLRAVEQQSTPQVVFSAEARATLLRLSGGWPYEIEQILANLMIPDPRHSASNAGHPTNNTGPRNESEASSTNPVRIEPAMILEGAYAAIRNPGNLPVQVRFQFRPSEVPPNLPRDGQYTEANAASRLVHPSTDVWVPAWERPGNAR